ncbi:MAG TPA: IS4 family transposase [Burkholderiales bacterium]|nr:IS4 family transposase [Burkholderiales bacterium]
MSWAAEEFETLDLGDRRLNRRAVLLAERLAAQPTASIPAACGGWAETQAAYRLLADDDIEWADILAPHLACTQHRMAVHPVVLCIQDTTELDFNGQAIAGLGPLSFEAQRGMYLHPTYAVSLEREPLGVLDAWMWAREPKGPDGTRGGISESVRWIEGYERIAEQAAALPATRLVYVADREADILALMVRAHTLGCPADWLVRAQHNRALPEGDKLWARVGAGEVLGEIRFTLPSRQGQKARPVRQQVRAARVTLRAGAGKTIEVSCVIAREIDAPVGVTPVEWRLLSNREAATFEAASELIDWYRARWEIELFFHVLKNGCKVEALQLATSARLERALTLFMVIAWRIGRLMRLGRACPELEAELLFERDEWEAAFILNKRRPPKTPPPLNEVLRLVATLGGFLGRKGDGEPGVKTIWLGLQRVMDFAAGLKYARGDHDE